MRSRPLHQIALFSLGFARLAAGAPLVVTSDFEGGSVDVIAIDNGTRSIACAPGGDPARGWPCWWFFRIDGIAPGETITVRLRGSDAAVGKPGAPMRKPIAPAWAMPDQATYSTDGKTWQHSGKGTRDGEWMVYQLAPGSASAYVAWGPPYTPTMAEQFVSAAAESSPHATGEQLCLSRGGRPVPMLTVREGTRPTAERFGVWVQARQHAWESGSSWVAQGFIEWLVGDTPDAGWLRRHADISVIPIMDVDNAATGNGGKDAQPHDHNRDWSPNPNWNEVRAAQRAIGRLIDGNRMDVFLDLHNPAPGDPTFFYVLDAEFLGEEAAGLRDRFIEIAYGRISRLKPMVPMSRTTKVTGADYHPLWRQISANWVAMNGNPHTVSLCLETIWNGPNSTVEGYRSVGGALAAATRDFLADRPTAR